MANKEEHENIVVIIRGVEWPLQKSLIGLHHATFGFLVSMFDTFIFNVEW